MPFKFKHKLNFQKRNDKITPYFPYLNNFSYRTVYLIHIIVKSDKEPAKLLHALDKETCI